MANHPDKSPIALTFLSFAWITSLFGLFGAWASFPSASERALNPATLLPAMMWFASGIATGLSCLATYGITKYLFDIRETLKARVSA